MAETTFCVQLHLGGPDGNTFRRLDFAGAVRVLCGQASSRGSIRCYREGGSGNPVASRGGPMFAEPPVWTFGGGRWGKAFAKALTEAGVPEPEPVSPA